MTINSMNSQYSVFEQMRSKQAVKNNITFKSIETTNPVQKTEEKIPTQKAELKPPEQQDTVEVSKQNETPKKKKSLWQSLKNGYTNIKKFFITSGEYIKGTAKGIFYGGIAAVGTIGVDAIINTVKKAEKPISTKGKVIAAGLAIATLGINLFKANLDANQKKAEVDHRWQTGHNE